jgi:hypothetical protein
MTNPDQDLLTTTEGVDEGSAAFTAEGPGSGAAPAAGTAPAVEGEQPAPPVEVDTDESRAARSASTGQQLQAGEG